MSKRVVFAGGGQAKALAKAYRLDVALDTDEDVFFIGAESVGRDAAKKVIGAADVLVTDLTPEGPSVPDDIIQVGTLRIAVPVAVCDFLWPFAGRPHPRNAYVSGLPDGPYPAGFGDSWLDAQAEDGVDEETAIADYLALDIAAAGRLDEKLQATLQTQARLDAQTGFDLADFIADRFRKQALFATRDRPSLPLFRHLAVRLFGQMGVAASRLNLLTETYFPVGAMPIHPGVLSHFGIEQPSAGHRYPVLDEGFFTFSQYCRRYLRFEYNPVLHAAIAKAESDPSAAIPQLRLALETSPESAGGLRALNRAERSVSDLSMLPPPALPPPRRAEEEPSVPAAANAPSEPAAAAPPLTLVPNAASGGVLATQDPRDTEEVVPLPRDPNHAILPAFGLTAWQRPSAASYVPGETYSAIPLSLYPAPQGSSTAGKPSVNELLPEPQTYVELPLASFEAVALPISTAVNMPMTHTDRYQKLAPADHLIALLPRMLPNTRKMADAAEKPFAAMPETMPPPPLRPMLPPELHPEPLKTSLIAKIIDQLRK